jgi:hypothetical protein
MQSESHHAPTADSTALPDTVVPGSAAIARLVPAPSGLAVAATGSYEAGVGRVDFVLVDLAGDLLTNIVDRKDIDYAKAPDRVAEAWESGVALIPELPYRVFFHVYDRTGVNLVAYDRRDFTCDGNGA